MLGENQAKLFGLEQKTDEKINSTPKLRFSESRFSEILGLVNKSQLP